MSAGPEIALTFDLEWAPDAVLADTLELLEQAGAAATLFATHETSVLDGLPGRYEVGLHPNFNPVLGGNGEDFRAPLDRLRASFPGARGVRSHSLVQSTPMVRYFAESGLSYDCNLYIPGRVTEPFYAHVGDFVRVPYGWEDDLHFARGGTFELLPERFGPGLHVFDFHPPHVFLNTESAARYEDAKAHYHAPAELLAHRNAGPVPGTRDFLKALLRQGWPTVRLGEVADRFRRETPP